MISSGNATIPVADSPAQPQLHEKHAAWIEARGISADLARKLGLETVTRHGKAWLAVPYVERGRVVKSGGGRDLLADADVQRAYLGI